MKRYHVRVSPVAESAVLGHASYIEDRSNSPAIADRWTDAVFDQIDSLEYFPRRCNLAEEDAHRPYEVRRQIIGNYLALFHVDDDSDTVHVIGFRHGASLPRPESLPDDPTALGTNDGC